MDTNMRCPIKISYIFTNADGTFLIKEAQIDFNEFRKAIVLNLYYSDMMKMRVNKSEIFSYSYCYIIRELIKNNIEPHVFLSHLSVDNSEILRLIAKLYSEKKVITEEKDNTVFFLLGEEGKIEAEKYLRD